MIPRPLVPLVLAALVMALGACPRAPGDRPPISPQPIVDAKPDGDAPAVDPAAGACGTENLRIDDLGWVPGTTRALVMLDLGDPQLPAALAKLAAHARAPGHGLPIDLALPLGAWTWQIPALRATLARAGLHPGDLAFVRTEEASGAFAFQHDCDVDALRERMAAAWNLSWRSLVEGALGRASPGADPPFAWDVLLLRGGRVLLVAAGRGDAWLRRLGPETKTAMGDALAEVGAAPIRGVIAGPSLVDPGTSKVPGAQTIRATAEGVTLGDSLSPQP